MALLSPGEVQIRSLLLVNASRERLNFRCLCGMPPDIIKEGIPNASLEEIQTRFHEL